MKKMLIIFSILALIITSSLFIGTYALFETDAEGEKQLDVAKWKITVNNADISVERNITLSDFVYSGNSHTEVGYFAPGQSAEYDIVIDTSECDVSLEYHFEIDSSWLVDYPNITFSIKDMDDGRVVNSNVFDGVILLNSTKKDRNIKIMINLNNNEANNETDSIIAENGMLFDMKINFKQYLG